MKRSLCVLLTMIISAGWSGPPRVHAEELTLVPKMRHLRIEGPREWSEFAEQPDATEIDIEFESPVQRGEWTLTLQTEDVKQSWSVEINGKSLGRLPRDENPMVVCFAVPEGTVREGTNRLRIHQETNRRSTPDDVRIGRISLIRSPRDQVLAASTLEVEVVDGDSGKHLPTRLTIVNDRGALQSVGAESNDHLAIRPGTVYTSDGRARFGLPAGRYQVFAGRGFEYSLDRQTVDLAAGAQQSIRLTIRRVVPTGGYVACDTHVHTLTHSGHGDATVQERMITLAAEGIELPIAADHNKQIDHRPFAREMNVEQYFTPVIGNEVTTPTAHFNIFPVEPGADPPDHRSREWKTTLDGIFATPGVQVAILNHARDLHGITPFAPQYFNEVTGELLDGWATDFTAMEVINSGATQTDPLRLFHDWMALLNRGHAITPAGSSDSHDVARHFVGQGRTYIRVDDSDPGNIDIAAAAESFAKGQVLVSYGLLTEMTVGGRYRSGDLAPAGDDEDLSISLRVLGPEWTHADRLTLYANGQPVRTVKIPATKPGEIPAGVRWEAEWELPGPAHDVHLVAIATGPGIDGLYWRTAKPYQPTSPDWTPRVIGCSGAVWVDADGDGRRTSAREYADGLFRKHGDSLPDLLSSLAEHDAAVAAQAAALYQNASGQLLNVESQKLIRDAAPPVRDGFRSYLDAWRASQIARASR